MREDSVSPNISFYSSDINSNEKLAEKKRSAYNEKQSHIKEKIYVSTDFIR